MEVYPLKSSLILPGDSLIGRVEKALTRARIRLRNRDIVAVASKVVALSEGRTRQLSSVKAQPTAVKLGRKYSMSPEFAQVVVDEAEEIYGGVPGALLTLKNGHAVANAGVDQKNAPIGWVVLWPVDPEASARRLQEALRERTGKRLGVVIVDSRVTPLRLGTVGLSIGSAGFRRVRDFRGKPDLYGRRARITLQAMSDGVAGAAQLLMGEAKEAVPFVLVRGAPVEFDEGHRGRSEKMRLKDCLYMAQISRQSGKSSS